jgi:hypothetical protein
VSHGLTALISGAVPEGAAPPGYRPDIVIDRQSVERARAVSLPVENAFEAVPGVPFDAGALRNLLIARTRGHAVFSLDDDQRLEGYENSDSGITREYPPRIRIVGFRNLDELYSRESIAPMKPWELQFKLMKETGAIATFPGRGGDSGLHHPLGLLDLSDESRSKYLTEEKSMADLLRSRILVFHAERHFIGQSVPISTGAYGFDNTMLLPPFPPAGTAESGPWYALLRIMYPDGEFVAASQYVLNGPKSRADEYAPGRELDFRPGKLLESVIEDLGEYVSAIDPAIRMRLAGSYLEEIGNCGGEAFRAFVRDLKIRYAGNGRCGCWR